MNGIKLACRYSYGSTTATKLKVNNLLLKGAIGRGDLKKIVEIFNQFEFLLFFKIIASERKEHFLEKDVVQAYWLADDIEHPCNSHGGSVLRDLEIIIKTRRIKEDVINILLDCLVLPARIKDIQGENSFLIEGKKVIFRNGKFSFVDEEKLIGQVVPDNFEKGQLVSFHLGKIRECGEYF